MCKPPSTIKPDFFEQSFMMVNMKGRLKESLEEIEILKKEIQELKEEIKNISSISKEWCMKFK
jgi:archaellum component FlaC